MNDIDDYRDDSSDDDDVLAYVRDDVAREYARVFPAEAESLTNTQTLQVVGKKSVR